MGIVSGMCDWTGSGCVICVGLVRVCVNCVCVYMCLLWRSGGRVCGRRL